MRTNTSIVIARHLNRALTAWLLAAILAFAAAPAFAHGGFDHVMGTVVQVANNVLTVKTSTGNVEVKLDDKTELTKGGHKAAVRDLTANSRVVIDIPEGSKTNLAHSIKIGGGGMPAAHDHDKDHDHDSK